MTSESTGRLINVSTIGVYIEMRGHAQSTGSIDQEK